MKDQLYLGIEEAKLWLAENGYVITEDQALADAYTAHGLHERDKRAIVVSAETDASIGTPAFKDRKDTFYRWRNEAEGRWFAIFVPVRTPPTALVPRYKMDQVVEYPRHPLYPHHRHTPY